MLGAVFRAALGLAVAALLLTFNVAFADPLVTTLSDFLGQDSQLVNYADSFLEFLPIFVVLGVLVDFVGRGVVEAQLPG